MIEWQSISDLPNDYHTIRLILCNVKQGWIRIGYKPQYINRWYYSDLDLGPYESPTHYSILNMPQLEITNDVR